MMMVDIFGIISVYFENVNFFSKISAKMLAKIHSLVLEFAKSVYNRAYRHAQIKASQYIIHYIPFLMVVPFIPNFLALVLTLPDAGVRNR